MGGVVEGIGPSSVVLATPHPHALTPPSPLDTQALADDSQAASAGQLNTQNGMREKTQAALKAVSQKEVMQSTTITVPPLPTIPPPQRGPKHPSGPTPTGPQTPIP